MIGVRGSGPRLGRRVALVAILLGGGVLDGLAQSPCDNASVKEFIADFSGSRAGPPPVWQACVDSLRIDPFGDHRRAILGALAALRARSGPAGEPIAAELIIFRGSTSSQITSKILGDWDRVLGVRRPEQRFGSVFHQALLTSLAWIALDRSRGLQNACVEPVTGLQNALGAGPDWRGLEASLLRFHDIPFWGPEGGGPTLTGLMEQVSGRAAADLRSACPAVRGLSLGPGYWIKVSNALANIPTRVACKAPRGCTLPVCKEADGWCQSPARASWARLLQTFDTAVEGIRQRAESLRNTLPVEVAWANVEARLEKLRSASERFHGSNDPDGRGMAVEVERDLGVLDHLSAQLQRLIDVAAYEAALTGLLRGKPSQARDALRGRENWDREPPQLVAAYVAIKYWEKGEEGRRAACQERGIRCASKPLAEALRAVASILDQPGLAGP